MNAPTKNLSTLAAAVMLALAAGSAAAVDNSITLEQAAGVGAVNGTGNYANIKAAGSGKLVSIYQIGNGTGAASEGDPDGNKEKNRVGDTGGLDLSGTGSATVNIGQGGYRSGNAWVTSAATKGNLVKGKIQAGDVEISQNSNNNTVDLVNVDSSLDGKVTITQGKTNGGGGGSGFTASVTQTGSGAVTITQGATNGTSGEATVIHEGSHTVAITQDRADAGGLGVVSTNTKGEGGTLTITHSGTGNTFVNDGASAATITGTATLANSGSGTLQLTKAEGMVKANVGNLGNLTISNAGSKNNVYVSSVNDGSGTAGVIGGNLTINSNGDNTVGNTIWVSNYTAGTTTINQSNGIHGSTLALSGGGSGSAVINQLGNFQKATVISANGSSGTFDLKAAGTASDALAAVNLTY